MKITRLGWAGLELESESGDVAVIDLLTSTEPMRERMGEAHTALPGPSRPGAARLALVTHLHQDHTDADAIAAALAPKGRLLRPVADSGPFLEVAGELDAERRLVELDVRQQVVREWETVTAGAFTCTAIPAADGFGDVQVSWIVEADGVRVFHGGDTLFHGWWWRAKMRAGGPIDLAFLPANGPVVSLPHRQPASPRNACLSPAEAAAAAYVLQAGLAIPIHYDALNNPPVYAQVDDPAGQFLAECAALDVAAAVVEPGQVVPDQVVSAA
jgi:L-ascorbate metabolism protein UlaG (beta-lactamase superfamily)